MQQIGWFIRLHCAWISHIVFPCSAKDTPMIAHDIMKITPIQFPLNARLMHEQRAYPH